MPKMETRVTAMPSIQKLKALHFSDKRNFDRNVGVFLAMRRQNVLVILRYNTLLWNDPMIRCNRLL